MQLDSITNRNKKKFEQTVEQYMKNKNIYKNNWCYLLQGLFIIFEEKVFNIMNKKTAQSLMHTELDILNKAVKLSSQYCTDTCRKDVELVRKIENFFNDVSKYNTLENLFILSEEGLLSMNINKQEVNFDNVLIDRQKQVLNFYNKLEYVQSICKSFRKETLKMNNPENPLLYCFENAKIILNSMREFYVNEEFDGFNIEEYYNVYLSLYAYAWILQKGHRLMYIESTKLIAKIEELINYPEEKIKKILYILTYQKNQKLDIICTPLFKVNSSDGEECYLSPPSLYISSNIERNALVLFNHKYKKIFSYKEESMQKRLKAKLSCFQNLKITFNINLYKENGRDKETDIDMAIYDTHSKSMLICELKNFNRADSVNEHINIQGRTENQQLNKAFTQIDKIRTYYEINSDAFVSNCGSDSINNTLKIVYFIVISKNNLGFYSKNDIKVLDESNLYRLIEKNKGNLYNVIFDIQNDVSNPIERKDFIMKNLKFNLAGYDIEYPDYRILHKEFV